MLENQNKTFGALITDSNGYVYLKQDRNEKYTLFYCLQDVVSECFSGFDVVVEEVSDVLTGKVSDNDIEIKLIEISPLEVVPSDILYVSLQDAISRIIDSRIDDILTVAALLKAEHFKLIKAKTQVIYEDEYCIAVNKPHGLLVHRTTMSTDKEFLLQRVRDQSGKKVFPVHRLDRPTSGLVLFAFSKDSISTFSKLFSERKVRKTYWALVRGWTDDSGTIDSPLKSSNGKEQEALTLYKTLASTEVDIPVRPYDKSRYSLVEIDLKTGRTHQIRRHFAHLRHPLIGDTTYGDGKHNKMFRNNFNSHRLMLHAMKLEFIHPFCSKNMSLEAPLERGFKNVLKKLALLEDIK